ncbi:MAG: hypothetical protein ACOX9C_08340 [Kiritimatiellia bacterium]|jgi:hypothetical protein
MKAWVWGFIGFFSQFNACAECSLIDQAVYRFLHHHDNEKILAIGRFQRVRVRKVTSKSGIAYVMRIEREFDALLSLQSSRTPHHRRPFLISEACFHCHAPPCTPPFLFSEE